MAIQWQPGPPGPLLLENKVHIWRANLDLPARLLTDLEQLLSPDERKRASRLRSPQLSRRFIAGRALLRLILARYLWLEPGELGFVYNLLGKPFLISNQQQEKFYFNLTHSHNLALFVIAENPAIGIDLEYLPGKINIDQVASYYFLPEELAILKNEPPAVRRQTFFNFWTAKEAYWKTCGQNLPALLQPLSNFRDDAFNLMETLPSLADHSCYCFSPATDYTAALVISQSSNTKFTCWDWSWETA